MTAIIFNKEFEIRVVWTGILTGYVNGLKFTVNTRGIQLNNYSSNSTTQYNTKQLNQIKYSITETSQYKEALREAKANELIVNRIINNDFRVFNPSNQHEYKVFLNEDKTDAVCSCDDYYFRSLKCKHIRATLNYCENLSKVVVPMHRKTVTTASPDKQSTEARDSLGI